MEFTLVLIMFLISVAGIGLMIQLAASIFYNTGKSNGDDTSIYDYADKRSTHQIKRK